MPHKISVEPESEAEKLKRVMDLLERFNNTEKMQMLSKMFVCRFDPLKPPDSHGMFFIKKGIFSNRIPEIANRCRFDPTVTVDLVHIARHCCGVFGLCQHYGKFRKSKLSNH